MEKTSNINETSQPLKCSFFQQECLITEIPSGQLSPSILISLIDTYGQKMTLENTIGSIDIAYEENYAEKQDGILGGNKLLKETNDKIILKGVKTVRLKNGSFNFSEVI